MSVLFILVALVVIAIVATVLTETEKFGWATLLLIVSVGLAQVFHVFNFWAYVSTHALDTILYVLGYVGVGVAWSFIKWFSFLLSFRDRFRSLKETYLSGLTLLNASDPPINLKAPVPPAYMKGFQEYLSRQYDYTGVLRGNPLNEKPRAVQNKARIVSWMSLWPCSIIGTLLNDPVRRLFNFLFSNFKALYQKMADVVFANDSELK